MSQTFGASTNQLPHATHNRYCKPSSTCMPSTNTNTKHWLPQTSCFCFRNKTNLKQCFILPTSKLHPWVILGWSWTCQKLKCKSSWSHLAHINNQSTSKVANQCRCSQHKARPAVASSLWWTSRTALPNKPHLTQHAIVRSSDNPVVPSSDNPVVPSSDNLASSDNPVVPSSDNLVPSSDNLVASSKPVGYKPEAADLEHYLGTYGLKSKSGVACQQWFWFCKAYYRNKTNLKQCFILRTSTINQHLKVPTNIVAPYTKLVLLLHQVSDEHQEMHCPANHISHNMPLSDPSVSLSHWSEHRQGQANGNMTTLEEAEQWQG